MKIQQRIEEVQKELVKRQEQANAIIAFLTKHAEALDALEVDIDVYSSSIDFNFLSHEKTVEVMKIVQAGSWKKSYNENTINYETKVDEVAIRVYNGAPPPNCKIIEEEVTEPSHYVPERKVIKRRVQCEVPEATTTPELNSNALQA